MSLNILLWGIYAAFVVLALSFNWHPALLDFSGGQAGIKLLVWALYLSFLAYSIYCSFKENIFRTIRTMSQLYWGRQIGIDLYLGLAIALILIYLHEGLLVMLLWLVPTILFANLAILLYIAIHLDTIALKLLGA